MRNKPLIAVLILLVSKLSFSHAQSKPSITDLVFSPDGESIVVCSQAGIQILSWPDLIETTTLKTYASNLHSVAFSPSNQKLFVGGGQPSEEGSFQVFEWPNLEELSKKVLHDDSVMQGIWLDDDRLVTASLDNSLKVVAMRSASQQDAIQAPGMTTGTLRGHARGVTSACLLNGEHVVSAGIDHSLRVWNWKSGKMLRSLNQHTQPIHAMALRPTADGLPQLASASQDGTIRFWQPTIGRMVRYVRLESVPLGIAWINPSQLAASCVDGQVRIVDTEEVKVLRTLPAIQGWAYTIAIHPTDGSLAVGGSDGQIVRIKIPKLN